MAGAKLEDVVFAGGQMRLSRNPSKAVSIIEVMKRANVKSMEEEATAARDSSVKDQYSMHSHSAIFAEVTVDEDLGVIRVPRVVSAVASGRILNPKTARSQIMGGIVWSIGMALEEESVIDHNFGRIMTHNLADYHVPVNADVRDIDVIFVEEHDSVVNPLGVKGLGEIGLVGVAAAISNAVFHATGKRVRSLPITVVKTIPPKLARRKRRGCPHTRIVRLSRSHLLQGGRATSTSERDSPAPAARRNLCGLNPLFISHL